MKIGIDGTAFSIPYPCGTQKYAQGLLNGLARVDSVNEYTIFALTKLSLPGPNFKLRVLPKVPLYNRLMLNIPEYELSQLEVFHKLDPYGILNLHHPRVITTIHDLGTRSTHSWFGRNWHKRFYNDLLFWSTLYHTSAFIVSSDNTKNELKEYLHSKFITLKQITTVHLGVEMSAKNFKDLHQVKKEDYILTMGDYSPRKNVTRTLEAFARLRNYYKYQGKLKIVVSSPKFVKPFAHKISELNLNSCVQIVVSISDNELCDYYSRARIFVYASLYEGFGLPIIESMSYGCPVITSNRGATKEVAANAAMLVDPESQTDITEGMFKLLNDTKIYNNYVKKGFARAKQFTWDETARQVLRVYRLK